MVPNRPFVAFSGMQEYDNKIDFLDRTGPGLVCLTR